MTDLDAIFARLDEEADMGSYEEWESSKVTTVVKKDIDWDSDGFGIVPPVQMDREDYNNLVFWQEMANNGFIIYQKNNKYVVDKIQTPVNGTKLPDALSLDTLEQAFDKVKELMVIKVETVYIVSAMYNLGFGPEFVIVGELVSEKSSDELADVADGMAQDFFYSNKKLKDVPFEIKVRPKF